VKLTNITKCRVCGGASLTWDTVNRVRNGIQQNRLNTQDVECIFYLGCDDCSETLALVKADTVAEKLNASAEPSAPKCGVCGQGAWACNEDGCHYLESGNGAPVERDERAEFESWYIRDVGIGLANLKRIKSGSGAYECEDAMSAWEGWQARAVLERKPK